MQLKLIIDNSMSRLEGLDMATHKKLQEVLSYGPSPEASFFSGNYTRKSLLTKKGVFPTGLLRQVREYLDSHRRSYLTDDIRRTPRAQGSHFNLKCTLTPYQAQTNAIEACLQRNGIVSMPTGTGKSITMALLVQAMQLKTLIIVPNLQLKLQLRESFNSWFGVNDKIVIENIDSKRLKNLKDFDILIIDEAHHSAAKTYRTLNAKAWNGIYHRYFFTATPYRSRDEETILFESVAGQVIYQLSLQDAINQKLIVPVEAYYYELPTYSGESLGSTWASVYSKLVVKNDYRNLAIAKLLQTLQAADLSTLCLVKEIAHGETLEKLTGFAFANGENEDSKLFIDLFNRRELKTIIGTTGVLGEGIDSKPCEYVIIAGLGKSKNQFMQQVGRGVRNSIGKESCKLILFQDKSHKWSKAHFKAQCKYLKDEYGIIPIKLGVL